MDVEKITPYSSDESKTRQVRDMFDHIAPRYDLLNRLMTLGGLDRLWRRKAIDRVKRYNPSSILDVATGTADLALLMARKIDADEIVGVDLSEKMLEIGRRKIERAELNASPRRQRPEITLRQGDSLHLPFCDSTFDCVTVAFGVRNFEDLRQGCAEMYRVLKPGGHLMILELSTPQGCIVGPLYRLYSGRVIPFFGKLISRDSNAYTYLPESIAAVPQGKQMAKLLNSVGFQATEIQSMAFGACTAYYAAK